MHFIIVPVAKWSHQIRFADLQWKRVTSEIAFFSLFRFLVADARFGFQTQQKLIKLPLTVTVSVKIF